MKYQIKMRKRFYCSCLLKSVLYIAWARNTRDFMEVSWNKGISRRHEIGSWIVWICCEIESKLNWKFIKVFSIQTCSINAKFTGIFYFLNKFDLYRYDLIITKHIEKDYEDIAVQYIETAMKLNVKRNFLGTMKLIIAYIKAKF